MEKDSCRPRVFYPLGKNQNYLADLYWGECYNNNINQLMRFATDIASASGAWTPKQITPASGLWSIETAEEVIQKGFKQSHLNTSMILFRELNPSLSSGGSISPVIDGLGIAPIKYIGFSWQEMKFIPTTYGSKPVLYFRLRAFEEKHRRQHLGRVAIMLALLAYPTATYVSHRTASAAAALSFIEAGKNGVYKPKGKAPWDIKYDQDNQLWEIAAAIWEQEHIKGRELNPITGVSIGDYIEPNRAYLPDVSHPGTMAIHRKMKREFKMIFSRGDSLYCVYEL